MTTPTRRELEAFLKRWPAPADHALNAALLTLSGAKMGDWLVGTVEQGGGAMVRRVLWQHHFWTLDGPVPFARFRANLVGMIIDPAPSSFPQPVPVVLVEDFIGDPDGKRKLMETEQRWMEVFREAGALEWVGLFPARLEAFLSEKALNTLPMASPLPDNARGRGRL